MKTIRLFLLLPLLMACSSDDANVSTSQVSLFVDHFKTTSILSGTALVVQENDAIGTSQYAKISGIVGFDFEPGYTYRLRANKSLKKNAGTSAVIATYSLIGIDAKVRVGTKSDFRVPLSTFVNGQGYVTFLRRRQDSTFILGNEIVLDCDFLCADLNAAFETRQLMTATFYHGEDDSYIMTELE